MSWVVLVNYGFFFIIIGFYFPIEPQLFEFTAFNSYIKLTYSEKIRTSLSTDSQTATDAAHSFLPSS